MNAAAFIFSNLNVNTLSCLTDDRTVAAIPFACRYRLIDFALSNMVNAGIERIGIVTNYNFRSLVEHVGSGKDWDLARRSGGVNIISPYQMADKIDAKPFSTHLEALLSLEKGYIRGTKEDYIILSDTDFICNIDVKDVLRAHAENDADITVVSAKPPKDFVSEAPKLFAYTDDDNRVKSFKMASAATGDALLSTNIFVFKKDFLLQLLDEANRMNYTSLTKHILIPNTGKNKIYSYLYDGYLAPVSSFRDYFVHSISLTQDPSLREKLFGVEDRPVFTNVHNSTPVLYRDGSSVKNSMIADGCVIEGTVENSILFRGVRVKKGAVVKNSILFFNSTVEENTTLNCVVADKSTLIRQNVVLSGHPTIPMYIKKGQII